MEERRSSRGQWGRDEEDNEGRWEETGVGNKEGKRRKMGEGWVSARWKRDGGEREQLEEGTGQGE